MSESRLWRFSRLCLALLLLPIQAVAQGTAGPAAPLFSPAQTLTAAALNAALAAPTITGGSINGAPIGASNAQSGRFTTLTALSNITQSAGGATLGPGLWRFNGPVQQQYTQTVAGTITPFVYLNQTLNGTQSTGEPFINSWGLDDKMVAAGGANWFILQHSLGAGFGGDRSSFRLNTYLFSPPVGGLGDADWLVGFNGAMEVRADFSSNGFFYGNAIGLTYEAVVRSGGKISMLEASELGAGVEAGGQANLVNVLKLSPLGGGIAPNVSFNGLALSHSGTGQQFFSGIAIGGEEGTAWPIAPTGRIIAIRNPETNPNKTSAFGVDFETAPGIEFTTAAWASPGFRVDGTGQIALGPATLGWSSSGVSIGAAGKVAAVSGIAAGGTGYVVGNIVRDAQGGTHRVATVSGGAVASLTTIKAPTITSGAAPANPVALVGGAGSGATINLTWTDASVVAVGSGRLRQSFAALVGAGTTQGGATAITSSFVRATATTGQRALRLPAAIAGDEIRVFVPATSSETVMIFPASGEEITAITSGALGVNASWGSVLRSEMHFRSHENGKWLLTTTEF